MTLGMVYHTMGPLFLPILVLYYIRETLLVSLKLYHTSIIFPLLKTSHSTLERVLNLQHNWILHNNIYLCSMQLWISLTVLTWYMVQLLKSAQRKAVPQCLEERGLF